MIETTVLVVGAGPTGLLLAAELHRRNVACRVIDAHSEPLHWDRATVVHPRSLEVFESLGLVERLLTAGVKQRMARLHSAGSVLGEIDLSICGSRFGFNIGISEEIVEELLNDYLQQQGGVVIRASRLVDLRLADDGMFATIEHDQTTEQVFARWVVGCDGLHSATRTLSGIDLLGHDIPEPWAVFDATVAGWPHSYEGNYAYLDRPPVILTALPDKRWRVYLRPTGPDSDLVADAMGTIGQYLPAVHFDDVAAPTRFHCHTKVAARFRSGRVLLAGDAAHVCSPAQGHGMNTGLQDAFNLAWKLALVCQGSCASSLLDSYEAERRPVAEMVTTSGDAVEDAQRVIDAAERRVRDETIRSVFADPSSRHHEAIAEAELDVDYADSPIVAGDRHDLLCPGQRLPDDIDVRLADGGTCRLHELTNRIGHTALLISGAAVSQDERTKIEHAVRAATDPSVIDEIVALATNPADTSSVGQILLPDAGQVGIGEITLLVIRPDGHIGLRADRNQSAAVQAYQALLTTGQA